MSKDDKEMATTVREAQAAHVKALQAFKDKCESIAAFGAMDLGTLETMLSLQSDLIMAGFGHLSVRMDAAGIPKHGDERGVLRRLLALEEKLESKKL